MAWACTGHEVKCSALSDQQMLRCSRASECTKGRMAPLRGGSSGPGGPGLPQAGLAAFLAGALRGAALGAELEAVLTGVLAAALAGRLAVLRTGAG